MSAADLYYRLPTTDYRLLRRCGLGIELRGAFGEHRIGGEAGRGVVLAFDNNLDAGAKDVRDDPLVDDGEFAASIGNEETDRARTLFTDDRAIDDIPRQTDLLAMAGACNSVTVW